MKHWMKLGLLICVLVSLCYAENKNEEPTTSQVAAEDDSDMYMEPLEDHEVASSSFQSNDNSGNWYPSFSRSFETYDHQPSGHSRPFFYNTYQQQEGAYSQRSEPPYQQNVAYNPDPKYAGYKGYKEKEEAAPQATADKSASLLGDGNFGVIQGGTFYAEKSNYDNESPFDDFSSYFRNGHGRPSYFYPNNPKPGKKGQHAQFENFKDFADINNTPDRQYSQYVVVYTNKNGTRTVTKPEIQQAQQQPSQETIEPPKPTNTRPRNILESLAMLDNIDNSKTVQVPTYDQGDVIEIPPEKKLSKSKRKLAKLLPEKKHKAKLMQKEKEMGEPLLALS